VYARNHANSSYLSQNTSGVYANSAYIHANAAFALANTGGGAVSDTYARNHANSAYLSQNTTGVYANSAYLSQNTTGVYANSAYLSQNTTGVYANSAYIHANAAFAVANAGGGAVSDTYARNHANAAFAAANNSGGTILNGEIFVTGLQSFTSNGQNTQFTLSTTPSSANQLFVYVDGIYQQSDAYSLSNNTITLSEALDANAVLEVRVFSNTFPELIYALEDDYVGVDQNTAQSIYGVGITLDANIVYEFEASFALRKTTGSTSHSVEVGFGGSLVTNHILYYANYNGSSLNTLSTPTSIMINTKSSTAISTSTNTNNHNVLLKGVISVGTGGTFVPQYRLSSVTGGDFSTLASSYIKLKPIGSANTNVNVGSWS
jgi:hypothetical protein